MASYFVTATGTDSGKTFVTAGLIRAARRAGRDCAAIKPILSGYTREAAAHSDPALLLEAMGRPVTEDNIAAISPWRFAAPLSPDMAAARENRAMPYDDMLTFCRAAIEAAPGALLVEGVGGAAVPLDDRHLVADWVAALQIPALLVAGTYLGGISHTLTAAAFLSARNVPIAALVLNESPDQPVPALETAGTLTRFLACPIHIIPRGGSDAAFGHLLGQLLP